MAKFTFFAIYDHAIELKTVSKINYLKMAYLFGVTKDSVEIDVTRSKSFIRILVPETIIDTKTKTNIKVKLKGEISKDIVFEFKVNDSKNFAITDYNALGDKGEKKIMKFHPKNLNDNFLMEKLNSFKIDLMIADTVSAPPCKQSNEGDNVA